MKAATTQAMRERDGGHVGKATRLRWRLEGVLPAIARMRRHEALPIVLGRKRIFIVPTGFGLGFAVMLAVMLAGALNYSNNAALLLTCLLAGAAAGSMLTAFRMLDGLRLDAVRAGTACAGDPLRVDLDFAATARARTALRLDAPGQTRHFSVAANTDSVIELRLPTTRRGWMPLPRLRVYSTWPFGLFRAWSWLNPSQAVLVYPRAEAQGPRPPGESAGSRRQRPRDGDDLASLRAYRVGDPMKLVAWKASARHEDLLVREFERPASQHEWTLDWRDVQALDTEARIARLARWVIEAHAAGARWTLRLPQRSLGPAGGGEHYHRCMAALALLP